MDNKAITGQGNKPRGPSLCPDAVELHIKCDSLALCSGFKLQLQNGAKCSCGTLHLHFVMERDALEMSGKKLPSRNCHQDNCRDRENINSEADFIPLERFFFPAGKIHIAIEKLLVPAGTMRNSRCSRVRDPASLSPPHFWGFEYKQLVTTPRRAKTSI